MPDPIRRYEPKVSMDLGAILVPDDGGRCVLYSDHERVVRNLIAESTSYAAGFAAGAVAMRKAAAATARDLHDWSNFIGDSIDEMPLPPPPQQAGDAGRKE